MTQKRTSIKRLVHQTVIHGIYSDKINLQLISRHHETHWFCQYKVAHSQLLASPGWCVWETSCPAYLKPYSSKQRLYRHHGWCCTRINPSFEVSLCSQFENLEQKSYCGLLAPPWDTILHECRPKIYSLAFWKLYDYRSFPVGLKSSMNRNTSNCAAVSKGYLACPPVIVCLRRNLKLRTNFWWVRRRLHLALVGKYTSKQKIVCSSSVWMFLYNWKQPQNWELCTGIL